MTNNTENLNPSEIQIDTKAVEVASLHRSSESELLLLVEQVEAHRIFVKLGYSSLFDYVVRRLQLSESVAFNLISVVRKAREIPALKRAVISGSLSVATARKIVPVLTARNQQSWIEAAATLPKRELERQVASVSPHARTPERIKPVAMNREFVTFGLPTATAQQAKRALDVLSKKRGRSVSLEELFTVMVTDFLKRQDPLARAERARPKACPGQVTRSASGPVAQEAAPAKVRDRRTPIPQNILHQVNLRDQGQCTFEHHGQRCQERRFLHLHHLLPVALGGLHSLPNIQTLCSAHHRHVHQSELF